MERYPVTKQHFIFEGTRYTTYQRMLYVSAVKHLVRGRIQAALQQLYKVWN